MNSSMSATQAKPYTGPLHAHCVTAITRDGEQETVILLSSNDEAAYERTARQGHLIAAVLEENSEAHAARLAACWTLFQGVSTETLVKAAGEARMGTTDASINAIRAAALAMQCGCQIEAREGGGWDVWPPLADSMGRPHPGTLTDPFEGDTYASNAGELLRMVQHYAKFG